VSAATDRYEQLVLARETHGGHNVTFIRAKRNESRSTINPSVPDSPSFVVAGITRRHDSTAQLLPKGSD
jgi:hypothetical protein